MPDEKRPITGFAVFKGFLWVLGAVAVLYAFHFHIGGVVDEHTSNPEFIQKVASQVRPAVVFDEKYSVIADQGGCQYVSGIDISLSTTGHPTQMIVHAVGHLAHEPVIESLSANEYMITAIRGKQHDWVFRLVPFGTVGDAKHLFRIEIVR